MICGYDPLVLVNIFWFFLVSAVRQFALGQLDWSLNDVVASWETLAWMAGEMCK